MSCASCRPAATWSPDLHERHGIRRQLEERGVPVVDGVADAVGEVHAVAQVLLPVVHVVDRVAAGPQVAALVDGGEEAALSGRGSMPCSSAASSPSSGSICEVWPAPLVWNLRANLPSVSARSMIASTCVRRPADDRLRRRGVDAHLQIGVVGEHRLDLFGGVLDERHEAGCTRRTASPRPRPSGASGADRAGGVGERQAAGEVGRRGLAERLSDHRTGFRTVMLAAARRARPGSRRW